MTLPRPPPMGTTHFPPWGMFQNAAIFLKGTNSERADDIPLIIHWLQQMEIASIIDQELAPPHGNRKG
ncbi:MAG: hypothetical protein QNJ55_09545, partial [Xenococcus sp. MO_188.B8]|nr:hypothetical protein [Xenococcus sp. MO_188.B8]